MSMTPGRVKGQEKVRGGGGGWAKERARQGGDGWARGR